MIRPRMFSIASVVWLYIGPGWALVGAFGLYLYSWLSDLSARLAQMPVPLVFLWFPGGALVLGILGTLGALSLLGSKESGRRMVQRASYGASGLLLAFTVSWMRSVTVSDSRHFSPSWAQVQMALLGLVCGVALAVPFFIIARKLGSPELRLQTK